MLPLLPRHLRCCCWGLLPRLPQCLLFYRSAGAW
jgi:hypothetical protein